MSEYTESFDRVQTDSKSSSSSWTSEVYDDLASGKNSTTKVQDAKSDDAVTKSFGSLELSDFFSESPAPEQAVNAIGKPANPGDSEPTPGDAKPAPTTGDSGPSVGDAKPMPGDSGPSVGDGPVKPNTKDDGRDSNGVPVVSPSEMGEVINRDVPPAVASGGKGDSLKSVARDHLGPGATDAEVDAHVKEIARINGIKDPDKPLTGEKILLPGHTKDGGFVTEDSEGNKRTIWHDGVVRIENQDRTGYVRRPNADGSASIHTWGPKPEQNSDLIRTPDGKYKIADGPNDKVGHEPRNEKEKLIAERQHIIDAADTKIANPEERARFKKDMQAFEDRMNKKVEEEHKRIDEQVAKNLMTKERAAELKAEAEAKVTKELAQTYKQTSRVLEAPDNPKLPLKEKDRTAIAEQIMHQAANPTSIDQGYHNTCNVATIETKLYTNDPSKAAQVIADVATTGKTQLPGPPPVNVEVDAGSLKPDREARNNPVKDGERSHASQILQVTMVNMHYAVENQRTTPPGKIRYEQHEMGKTPDTGERLMDYSKNPPRRIREKEDDGKLVDSPQLSNYKLGEIESQILGKGAHETYFSDTTAHSEEDFNSKLAHLKEQGKLPATIMVHTDNYPFHSDGGESAGGKGGWHVVTVTDYNPGPPPKVQVDNQWGSDDDRFGDKALTVKDLYNAMRDPKDTSHIADLQLQIEKDKREGKPVDVLKETELLRLKRRAGILNDQQLSAELERVFMENARKLNKKLDDGTITDKDREDYTAQMNDTRDLRATLSPAEQKKLNERILKKMKEENIRLYRK